MDMSPQRVRSAQFKPVRKGVDPDEVRVFLNDVADELERAQNQSTAMEARARAAVARLQEVGEASAEKPAPVAIDASVDESETISRTLLLAQRTADTTIAEARHESERLVTAANNEAATTLDSTRELAAQLIDEARVGARQAGEAERLAVLGEVEALKARRDFLESDVEQLQIFLADQRNRIREAATSLLDVVDRVPGGLADVHAPLLSASHDDEADDPGPATASAADAAIQDDDEDDLLIVTDIADADDDADDEADEAADATDAPTDAATDPWSAEQVEHPDGDDACTYPPCVAARAAGITTHPSDPF